jgi:hypothetical protein
MSKVHHGYEELPQEQIDDPDGARAIFSRRQGSPPLFTVAFFKTFKGPTEETQQTSFFTKRALGSLRRVVDKAEKRLDELMAAADAAPSQSANRR